MGSASVHTRETHSHQRDTTSLAFMLVGIFTLFTAITFYAIVRLTRKTTGH